MPYLNPFVTYVTREWAALRLASIEEDIENEEAAPE